MTADVFSGRITVGPGERAESARLSSLDSLRGLAALSVVVCHYFILLSGTAIGQFLAACFWLPPLLLFKTASGSVVLFFVLSGYVLTLSLRGERRLSWGGFAVRRFCRIWPPYAIAIFISFAMGRLAHTIDPMLPAIWQINTWHSDDLTLHALLGQLGMISSHMTLDVAAWSLGPELKISLVFPFLLFLMQRRPAIIFPLLCLLYVAGRMGPPWLSQLVPDTATYVVYFGAGAWLALNRSRIASLGEHVTVPTMTLLCAIALILLSVPSYQPGSGIVTGLGAVLLIALVTASSRIGKALSARWCTFLGRISYSLYLTHVVVLMGLGRLLGVLLPVPLILALGVPIIGLVAWIGYRWVEQPSNRLGRSVAARLGQFGAARWQAETSPTS